MLSAAGVASVLGIEDKNIVDGLAATTRVPGRLERVNPTGVADADTPAVFVDYAHTPDGLENVLATIKEITPGRLICVFGCGGDRDQGKRPMMGEVVGKLADVVIVSSDNPRGEDPMKIIAEIEPGVGRSGKKLLSSRELFSPDNLTNGYALEANRSRAIHLACGLGKAGDVVIIAGKGHEQYQVVGLEKKFFDDRLEAKNALARWTVASLLAATGGRLTGAGSSEALANISTDTRLIQSGDVYLALRGESFDGHDFIQAAVAKGARALIVEREPSEKFKIPVVKVADTLQALGDLAAYRRRLLAEDLKVVALTGSSGKTTVKEMTATILEQFFPSAEDEPEAVLKTKGNFNNLIGLPLSLLPLKAEHKVAVLEMGMNQVGEIERLTEIADPDIACINNIQPAHLEGLGSIEGVAAAKGELFAGLRGDAVQVVNYDDPHVVKVAKKYPGEKIGFAITAAGRRRKPVVRVTRIAGLGEKGSRFTLHVGEWQKRITLDAPGIHNIHNAAAATALCHAVGVDEKSIVAGLSRYTSVDKRMQFMQMPGGLMVLNDSYNANPASMAAALQTVATFGTDCRRVAALGDMFELGDNAVEEHRKIGRLVAELGFDMLAVTGELSRETVAGAREAGMGKDQILHCIDTITIADWLYHMLITGRLSQDDWLLVKGSRGMRMENLLVELQNRFDPAGVV
jgi:murE/murF fusion protein